MYKLPDGNDEIYNKYITHLTKEDILNGVDLTETLSRRLFSLTLSLGGGNIPDKELGGLEFEMDMGVDDWPIGQVTYKKLAFTVANDSSDIEDGMKTGQVVKPVIGLQALDGVSKETTLKVPYGTYVVDSVAKDMTMKNYSCYDQLYYINDVDCDFGGETYPTTVGHILSTITGKYADKGMIPLSDDHQGDWAEWWNDEIGQPKKYKDYEAPPEDEEDDSVEIDPFAPVEANFPEDAGQVPSKNPGACCDCDHSGDSGNNDDGKEPFKPEFSEGLNIILNSRCELFPDRKYGPGHTGAYNDDTVVQPWGANFPLLARILPFDDDPNLDGYQSQWYSSGFSYNRYIEIKWYTNDENIAQVFNESCEGRFTSLRILKPGVKVTITAEAFYNGPTSKSYIEMNDIPSNMINFKAKKSIEIEIPNVSKDTLLKDFWNGKRVIEGDLSDKGWDPTNIDGGGFYTSSNFEGNIVELYKQTGSVRRNDSSSQCIFDVVGDPEIKVCAVNNNRNDINYYNSTDNYDNYGEEIYSYNQTLSNYRCGHIPGFRFNTLYSVINITGIHDSCKKYFKGISFFGRIDPITKDAYMLSLAEETSPWYGIGCDLRTSLNENRDDILKTHTRYNYGERNRYHAYDYVLVNGIESIAIPNYFCSNTSWKTAYQNCVSYGVNFVFDMDQFEEDNYEEYEAFMNSDSTILTFEIKYFGRERNLNLEEYKYLNSANHSDFDYDYFSYLNYPNTSNYYCADYANMYEFETITRGRFFHIGSITEEMKDWYSEYMDWQIATREYYEDWENSYIPLYQNGEIPKWENSIWYKTNRLVIKDEESMKGIHYLPVNRYGDFLEPFEPIIPDDGTEPEIPEEEVEGNENPVAYSLLRTTRTLSAPKYNASGDLIATYAEEADPNDPAQTPNSEGQVLVTTPEEIGFEMKEGQMLGYIAAYCGGNIAMDHEGEVRLLRLVDPNSTTEDGKVGYDKHIPNSQVAIPEIDNCEASSTLGGLIIHTSTYEGDDIKLGSEKPTQSHYVIEIDNPFMTKERASKIFEEMSSLTYYPMRVVILSDPRLWLGDLLYFDGFSQYNEASGVNVEVVREGYYPIMKLVSHYDGAPSLQIEANCSNLSDRSNSFTGSLNDKIDEVSAKVVETNTAVNEMKYQIEEIRALVGYINELFAIKVNADNIVSATISTKNIRIAPTRQGVEGGIYIDGDSIDFIDQSGIQRLHIGSSGDPEDYYIRFLNKNGYTRDLRALDAGGCGDGNSSGNDEEKPPEIPEVESHNMYISLEGNGVTLDAGVGTYAQIRSYTVTINQGDDLTLNLKLSKKPEATNSVMVIDELTDNENPDNENTEPEIPDGEGTEPETPVVGQDVYVINDMDTTYYSNMTITNPAPEIIEIKNDKDEVIGSKQRVKLTFTDDNYNIAQGVTMSIGKYNSGARYDIIKFSTSADGEGSIVSTLKIIINEK